ncbi:Olfactory receptor 2K2 [Heterocephalus glaber]|uniref:Olfactory receptor 2K2 n=1 Tax=Heterocephalus glaber TaxID=10181 RepID=G5C441_HETGA|nr:Olfactory receptor 2K2 [Heterocephalus glaber]
MHITLSLEATKRLLLAVDRCTAICYLLRYLLIMSQSMSVMLALGAWAVDLFASVVPLYFTILPLCGTMLCPFVLSILSYLGILGPVMSMDSTEGRNKAFLMCSSHLAVLIDDYGAGLIRYLRPKSLYLAEGDKLISVFHTVINPMMNLFIYTLRNSEVKGVMASIMGRLKKV